MQDGVIKPPLLKQHSNYLTQCALCYSYTDNAEVTEAFNGSSVNLTEKSWDLTPILCYHNFIVFIHFPQIGLAGQAP